MAVGINIIHFFIISLLTYPFLYFRHFMGVIMLITLKHFWKKDQLARSINGFHVLSIEWTAMLQTMISKGILDNPSGEKPLTNGVFYLEEKHINVWLSSDTPYPSARYFYASAWRDVAKILVYINPLAWLPLFQAPLKGLEKRILQKAPNPWECPLGLALLF